MLIDDITSLKDINLIAGTLQNCLILIIVDYLSYRFEASFQLAALISNLS